MFSESHFNSDHVIIWTVKLWWVKFWRVQIDLPMFSTANVSHYTVSTHTLYNNVTVILGTEFALKYHANHM